MPSSLHSGSNLAFQLTLCTSTSFGFDFLSSIALAFQTRTSSSALTESDSGTKTLANNWFVRYALFTFTHIHMMKRYTLPIKCNCYLSLYSAIWPKLNILLNQLIRRWPSLIPIPIQITCQYESPSSRSINNEWVILEWNISVAWMNMRFISWPKWASNAISMIRFSI